MNGQAPNCSCTGSQRDDVRNEKPVRRIEAAEAKISDTSISAGTASTVIPKSRTTPAKMRSPR